MNVWERGKPVTDLRTLEHLRSLVESSSVADPTPKFGWRPATAEESAAVRFAYANSFQGGPALAPGTPENVRLAANDVDSYITKLGKSFLHGFSSILPSVMEDAGGAMSWVAQKAGLNPQIGNAISGEGLKIEDFLNRKLAVENPDFGIQLASGFGSLIGFFGPGLAARAVTESALAGRAMLALGKSPQAAKVMGLIFGSATSAALESATEASEKESELIRGGMSPAEAFQQSRDRFWANMPVIMATDALEFTPMGKLARIWKAAINAASEGAQESYQTAVQYWADGKSMQEIFKSPAIRKEMLTTGAIGAITGGVAGAILGGENRKENQDDKGIKLDDAPNVDFKSNWTRDQIREGLRAWKAQNANNPAVDTTDWSADWINALGTALPFADNEALSAILDGWIATQTAESVLQNPVFMEFGQTVHEEMRRRGAFKDANEAAIKDPNGYRFLHIVRNLNDTKLLGVWQSVLSQIKNGPTEDQASFEIARQIVSNELKNRGMGEITPQTRANQEPVKNAPAVWEPNFTLPQPTPEEIVSGAQQVSEITRTKQQPIKNLPAVIPEEGTGARGRPATPLQAEEVARRVEEAKVAPTKQQPTPEPSPFQQYKTRLDKYSDQELIDGLPENIKERVKPTLATETDEHVEAARAYANVVGMRVVFFHGDTYFSGLTVSDKESISYGTVFINTSQEDGSPLHAVVGHEMIHWLKRTHPDLFKKFMETVVPTLNEYGAKYAAFRSREYIITGMKSAESVLTSGIGIEEAIAEASSSMVGRESFWNNLAEKAPDVFRKLADHLLKMVSYAAQKIKAIYSAPGAQRLGLVEPIKFTDDVVKFERALTEAIHGAAVRNQIELSKIKEEQAARSKPVGLADTAKFKAMQKIVALADLGKSKLGIPEAEALATDMQEDIQTYLAGGRIEDYMASNRMTKSQALHTARGLGHIAMVLMGSKRTELQRRAGEIMQFATDLKMFAEKMTTQYVKKEKKAAPAHGAKVYIPDVTTKRNAAKVIAAKLGIHANVAEEIVSRFQIVVGKPIDAIRILDFINNGSVKDRSYITNPLTGRPLDLGLMSPHQKIMMYDYLRARALEAMASARDDVINKMQRAGARRPPNKTGYTVFKPAVPAFADWQMMRHHLNKQGFNTDELDASRVTAEEAANAIREASDPKIKDNGDDDIVFPAVNRTSLYSMLFGENATSSTPEKETLSPEMDDWIERERMERDYVTQSMDGRGHLAHITEQLAKKFIDDLHVFQKIVERTFGEIKVTLDPVKWARILRGWSGVAQQFVANGVRTFDTFEPIAGNEGLGQILNDPKYQVETHWLEANYYLIAKRIVAMAKKPELFKKVFMTEAGRTREQAMEELNKATRIVETYDKAFPDWAEMADRITKYSNSLVQYMVDGGMLSQDDANRMFELYGDFVPLEVLDLVDKSNPGLGGARDRARNPVRSMGYLRGETAYVPPITGLVRKTFQAVRLANENRVKILIGDLIDSMDADVRDPVGTRRPNFGYHIDQKQLRAIYKKASELAYARGLSPREVKRELVSEFGDVLDKEDIAEVMSIVGLDKSDLDAMVKLMITSDNQGSDVVRYLKNGEVRMMRVNREIYEALTKLNHGQVAEALRMVSWMTKWLRAGATLNPEFAGTNPFRDLISVLIQGKGIVDWQKGPMNGLRDSTRFMRGWFRAWGQAFKRGDEWNNYMASFAGMAEQVAVDFQDLEGKTNEMLRNSTKPGINMAYLVKHPLYFFQLLSSTSESVTRMAVLHKSFDDVMKTGKYTVAEAKLMATMNSREASLDFNKMGSAIPPLNMMCAFLNAYIRGQAKMFETFTNKRTRTNAFINAAVFITLPSVLLWAINHDQDWYKKRPRWEKNLFWIVSPDDGKTRFYLPKPFELGLVFGSMFERFLDQLTGADRKAVLDWVEQTTVRQLPNNVLPPISSIVEGVANFSFFKGERIVPAYMETMPKPLQYTERTHELAKIIGKLSGQSPMLIDNWVRGTFAGLGTHAEDLVDYLILGAKGQLRKDLRKQGDPARHWMEDIVFFKAFIRTQPEINTRYADDFFDMYQDAAGAKTALNSALKGRLPKSELKWIYDKYAFQLSIYDYMTAVANQASEVTAQIHLIASSQVEMDPKEKREKLDSLYKARNQLFVSSVDQIDRLRHNPDQWRRVSAQARAKLDAFFAERTK